MKKKIDLKKIKIKEVVIKPKPEPIKTGIDNLDKVLENGIKKEEFFIIPALNHVNKETVVIDKRAILKDNFIKDLYTGELSNTVLYYSFKTVFEIVLELFENIEMLNTLEQLDESKITNGFINEYKYDKNVLEKLRNDKKPYFFMLLRTDSGYFKEFISCTLLAMVNYIDSYDIFNKETKNYVNNELFNIINYRKTTVLLLSHTSYNYVHDLFKHIKDKYIENFIISKKKYYTKSDFNLEPLEILKDNTEYKVVYVVPRKVYDNNKSKISKLNFRGLMSTVVLDDYGVPINNRLWDCVARINKNYSKNFAIRCLIPKNIFVKELNIIKPDNNFFVRQIKANLSFSETINKKLSVLIFTNIETHYNRIYL